jgi:hypothetical protein
MMIFKRYFRLTGKLAKLYANPLFHVLFFSSLVKRSMMITRMRMKKKMRKKMKRMRMPMRISHLRNNIQKNLDLPVRTLRMRNLTQKSHRNANNNRI